MWQMSVVLMDISWTVTPAMACTEAVVDGHTCFLLLTAATNTYDREESPSRPGPSMI